MSSSFYLRKETDAVSEKLFTFVFFGTEMLDEVQKRSSPRCNAPSELKAFFGH
jgi:hypothetical protein